MTQQSNFAIDTAVTSSLDAQPIVDIHTHLCPLSMPDLALYGPDELVTYHYLKAETSRQLPQGISVTEFNGMAKPDQADVIWKALFVGDSSPVSEAQLGIVTVMSALGLDPRAPDLSEFRQFCSQMPPEDYFNMVFEKAGMATVYMTNDPLDELEGPVWKKGIDLDPRFKAVLRLDSALMGWPDPVEKLRAEGYEVETELTEKTFAELRRYLNDWCDRIDARYMAISLPPDFAYPDLHIAIYCDGFAYHGNVETLSADARKRNRLQAMGWLVLTFWGRQILQDPARCADEMFVAHKHRRRQR